MMQQYIDFVIHHWALSATLVLIAGALMAIEFRGQLKGIAQLSPQQATRLMNHELATVLDVRDGHGFAAGHILGAISVPLAELASKLSTLSLQKDQPIIVACNVGQSSLKAAEWLLKEGFSRVNNLQGGMTAWKAANMPIVKG